MTIGAVGMALNYGYVSGATVGAARTAAVSGMQGQSVTPVGAVPEPFSNAETERINKNPFQKAEDVEDARNIMKNNASEKLRKRLGFEKCETCAEREYVDGSNENDVSFKTPAHIDPSAAASAVSAHERMHVANAIQEGNKPDAKLVSVSVSLHTSICPECGRVYVSGGETRTQMKHTADHSDIKDAELGVLTGKAQKPVA